MDFTSKNKGVSLTAELTFERWLMTERVRVSGWGHSNGATISITISGVPEDRREHIEGTISGAYWMTANNGELAFSPTKEPLPDPVEDADMAPFWRRYEERQGLLKEMIFDPEERCDFPSFMVKHLCGYHYTPEDYRANAILLESYGFVCMRSQRGHDGKFWETWYLPGSWAAKGELEAAIKSWKHSGKEQDSATAMSNETKNIVSFLCRRVSFGSLDVVVQRAAMVMDD